MKAGLSHPIKDCGELYDILKKNIGLGRGSKDWEGEYMIGKGTRRLGVVRLRDFPIQVLSRIGKRQIGLESEL